MDRPDAIVAIGSLLALSIFGAAEVVTLHTCTEEPVQIEDVQAQIDDAVEQLRRGLDAIPLATVARARMDAEWSACQVRTIRRHLAEAGAIIRATLDAFPEHGPAR